MKEHQMINIAVALDSNYVRYTYVMLTSLFEKQDKNAQIHIYVLQSELTESEKACLEKLVKSYGGFIHWVQIDPSYFPKACMEFANWPVESFYRLVLPEILPEEMDRILYLDVDIIINHSLKELYHTDFEGMALCACPEPFSGIGVFEYRDEMFKKHVREGFIYFNSGVLLMNLQLLREKYGLNSYMKVAEEYNYRLETPDQDLLNYVHWKDTKYVDTVKYNLFARFAHNFGVGYEEAKSKVTMVHFLAGKPWNAKIGHFEMERLWWDYAKKTPFYYDFRREFINEAKSKEKADKDLRLMTEEGINELLDKKSEIVIPTDILLKGIDMDEETLFAAVTKAEELGEGYIVINTEGVSQGREVTDVLENCIDLFMDKEIEVYLENGFVVSDEKEYLCSELSEISNLKKIVQQFNRICEKDCFGISINVDSAKLLYKNPYDMIKEAGSLLKLIY